MPAKSPEAVAAQPASDIPMFEINLLQTDGVILISALETLNAKHLEAINNHQQEILNPSLMNPQPEFHTTMRDQLMVAHDYNNELIRTIADAAGIDLSPTVEVVVEAAPGVDSPAEHNRPPQANPGAMGVR